MSERFDLKAWSESVPKGKYSYQTVHPLATRTVAEIQDIANAAEAKGQCLKRNQFTPYEWEMVIQFILTIRDLPEMSRERIAGLWSTDDLPSA
jgi:hypothetical protein